jgi:hypothetical protein
MMKTTVLIVLGSCALGSAVAADNPAGQQILPPSGFKTLKLGLWEETLSSQAGPHPQIDMSQIDTSSFTPEQRARVEAVLKRQREQAAAKGNAPDVSTKSKQYCLKASDVSRDLLKDLRDDRPGCELREVSRTATRIVVHQECSEKGVQGTMDMSYEVKSPTTLAAEIKTSGALNGREFKRTETMNAHWIGADCGTVK